MRSLLLPARAKRPQRPFWRDGSGATAVEFALLAPLFFFLLFATVESGRTLLTRQIFTMAVSAAERQVRLAPSLRKPVNGSTVLRTICNSSFGLLACDKLVVSLSSWPDNGIYCPRLPCAAQQFDYYTVGIYGYIMRLTVTYDWPTLLPLNGLFAPSEPQPLQWRELRIFRKEPLS